MADDGMLNIAVIGTGTGDGELTSGTIVTPSGQPNIGYQVVQPIVAILVRFAHLYLVTFSGVITASQVATKLLPFHDFWVVVTFAGQVSLAAACAGAVKDLIVIFAKLGQKFPLLMGEV